MKQVEMVSTHIRRQMVTPIKGFFWLHLVEKEIIAKKQGGGGGGWAKREEHTGQ
jgi:hypothetical protein